MNEMVAVIFKDEKSAYEGTRALAQMNAEGSVDVLSVQVVNMGADGIVSTNTISSNDFPAGTVGGSALGALVGALAGPVGAATGAVVGAWAGLIGDLFSEGIDADFVSDVAAALTPGKWAVLAEVDEEWITPLDTRMEALGGVVYRTPRSTVRAEQWQWDTAPAKARLERLKIEHAKAQADRKANLQAQIERLSKRVDARLARAQARSQEATREYEARVQALQQKADKEDGDARAALEARIAKLRSDYQGRVHA